MAEERVPLVGSLLSRNTDPLNYATKDQLFINCYPELTQNPVSQALHVNLYKRLGFEANTSAAAGYTGLPATSDWNKSTAVGAFAYLNGTTLSVYDSTDVIIGAAIAGITGGVRITETQLGADSYLTMVATKSADGLPHAWFIKEGDVAWTEIVDVDYPANQPTPLTTVGPMVHLDGYAFIMDTRGQVWNSDLNSLANWTITSFTSAQLFPDGGAGLGRLKNVILAFGTRSLEFFQNTNNAAGSPLTRIASAATRYGAIRQGVTNSETIKAIGDDIFFIGLPADSNARGVYKVNGYTVTKVSTPFIDRYIQSQIGGSPPGIAGVLNLHDMKHVVLYTAQTFAYVFCVDTNFWWRLDLADGAVLAGALGIGGKSMLNSTTNRTRYAATQSAPVFQDAAATLTMTVQTQNIDHGNSHKKAYSAMEIIGDTQTVAGTGTLSWSDDDYATFSTGLAIDMTKQRKRAVRGGASRRRAWKYVETVNRPFHAEALQLTFTVGP